MRPPVYDARVSRRPRILDISFSPIIRDARVMRQVSVLARLGDVTTVGYGPKPPAATHHLEIPADLNSLPRTPGGVLRLATRQLTSVERSAPGVARAEQLIGDERYDLVVSNDARALPLAHKVAHGAPVWADMHEWAAEEFSHDPIWRTFVAPLMDHACKKYLPQSAAVTTVCDALAERYQERYGVTARVVRNAGAFVDLAPTPPDGDKVRLVHSGGAQQGRYIELLIAATKALGERYSLDLFLVAGGDGGRHLQVLRDLAGDCDRITFHDPVAPADLPATLNRFDVGVFCMPPINTNARYALPNKFFDFVQARLAVAVGPADEMARLVKEHDLGVVSDDFSEESFAAALSTIDRDSLVRYKQASDVAARPLSSETDEQVEVDLVQRLLGVTAG